VQSNSVPQAVGRPSGSEEFPSLLLMIRCPSFYWRSFQAAKAMVLVCACLFASHVVYATEPEQSLELSRPVRPWEFVSALGTRAALLGREQGTLEAWVYPLKILSDFRLQFKVDGTVITAEALARTLIVRPESTTIVYTGDSYSVRETLFVPVHEPGAIIAVQVQTVRPLQVEALFRRDFQLEWPGRLEAWDPEWNEALHAFEFADMSGKFEALVGSPDATRTTTEYSSNYFDSNLNSFSFEPTRRGSDTKLIVIAASFTGHKDLPGLYHHLFADYASLLQESAKYYKDHLAQTVSIHVPDAQIETAYDWARVNMLQSIVDNPFLGEGLAAGFATSHGDYRPGFAWFFGRDAEWTSLALTAEGDFLHSRIALDFLSKFQRADGKITHEMSQSATLMDWFKTQYPYASADATPLYIIALDDYVTRSGDVGFARDKWDSAWRAYSFLKSTYDSKGLAQNAGVGTGWIEGGPLYPVQAELYQATLGVQAMRALSHLAHLVQKEDTARELEQAFDQARLILDNTFWSPEKQIYAYALDSAGKRIDIPSVLAAVPLWFRLLDEDHARTMIQELTRPDQQADWGIRIMSSQDAKYDPAGYHFGTVWPLFTGWASVGEYNYHRPLPAYSNVRANALLALDASLGHVAEVLSGDYNQTLSTGSPQQIWSAAMVVSPLLTGLMGLHTDAANCHVIFTPHVPADWAWFSVDNLNLGGQTVDLNYRRTTTKLTLQIHSMGAKSCSMEFSPAFSLRAKIQQARLNGRPLPFHAKQNSLDQHVTIELPLQSGDNNVEIDATDDFELSYSSTLPPLGASSHGLRVISQSWSKSRDALTVQLSGSPGENYELSGWNTSHLSWVEGAQLDRTSDPAKVRVQLPGSPAGTDPQTTIVFHFAGR
jgi:glycogen debranching enzyme